MQDMLDSGAREALKGEFLLYITPPEKHDVIDRYFDMGASRIACSLEVWDYRLGVSITPGKRSFTTKQRHLDALTYISEKYGPSKSFCNFIIGLEPFETLKEGATYLAERGGLAVRVVSRVHGLSENTSGPCKIRVSEPGRQRRKNETSRDADRRRRDPRN